MKLNIIYIRWSVLYKYITAVIVHRLKLRSGKQYYKIDIGCFTAKTGRFEIRIMFPRGVICLPTDCCFSELIL
jgi:hypothetical protein